MLAAADYGRPHNAMVFSCGSVICALTLAFAFVAVDSLFKRSFEAPACAHHDMLV